MSSVEREPKTQQSMQLAAAVAEAKSLLDEEEEMGRHSPTTPGNRSLTDEFTVIPAVRTVVSRRQAADDKCRIHFVTPNNITAGCRKEFHPANYETIYSAMDGDELMKNDKAKLCYFCDKSTTSQRRG